MSLVLLEELRVAYVCFQDISVAEEVVRKLNGVDMKSGPEKRLAGDRPAEAWERFIVQKKEDEGDEREPPTSPEMQSPMTQFDEDG